MSSIFDNTFYFPRQPKNGSMDYLKNLIAGKADKEHTHLRKDIIDFMDHNHDERYYRRDNHELRNWYHGNGNPDFQIGLPGDFYLDTLNQLVYIKEGPYWQLQFDMKSEGASVAYVDNHDKETLDNAMKYADDQDKNILKTAKEYTDAKSTIILVNTKGKKATKDKIIKWGKEVSVWYDSEVGNKYELKEGFLVILPVTIEGTSDKVGILGKVTQITPKLIQVQGYLVIEDYNGINPIFNVEIEKDQDGNYTADYNANDINNARNSGQVVQAKYYDEVTDQTFTYYYSTMESDRRPTFIRTYVEGNKTIQVLVSVDFEKKVTSIRKETNLQPQFDALNQEIDQLTGEVSDVKLDVGTLHTEQILQNDAIQKNVNAIADVENGTITFKNLGRQNDDVLNNIPAQLGNLYQNQKTYCVEVTPLSAESVFKGAVYNILGMETATGHGIQIGYSYFENIKIRRAKAGKWEEWKDLEKGLVSYQNNTENSFNPNDYISFPSKIVDNSNGKIKVLPNGLTEFNYNGFAKISFNIWVNTPSVERLWFKIVNFNTKEVYLNSIFTTNNNFYTATVSNLVIPVQKGTQIGLYSDTRFTINGGSGSNISSLTIEEV